MDTAKRDELVGKFVLASMSRPVVGNRSSDLERILYGLIYDFGHDPETQDVIMRGLDELSEACPAQARELALISTTNANVRHGWSDTEEGKANNQKRTELESKLALLWRHMLINAEDISHGEKAKEAYRVYSTMRMSSSVLVSQAQEAVQHLRDNPVYAAQPW